jgi:hypothetical protein
MDLSVALSCLNYGGNMNNHEPKKHSTEWYEDIPYDDTRYYGLFLKGKQTEKQTVSVDMKRFCEYFHIDDDRKDLKTNKKSQLFKPAKSKEDDYKVNVIKKELSLIKKEWIESQKIFIDQFLSEIKGCDFTAADDDNFQMGIADYDEAATNACIKSALSYDYAEYKKKKLYFSLYAQYFHQLAAQIDAVTLKLLTDNGYELDDFDRRTFLAFKGPRNQDKKSSIKGLDTYKHHQKMYALWNFIKHNSKSSYEKVKKHCPEILIDHEYNQGDLACYFVKFSNDLIEQTIDGVQKFLIDYCELVFDEDEREAEWNYEDFFHSYVSDAINDYYNPLGLPDY